MDWEIFRENLFSWQACLLLAVGFLAAGIARHNKKVEKQLAEIISLLKEPTKALVIKREQDGRNSSMPTVRVHMIVLDRIELLNWHIGKDVSPESLEKFRDQHTGDLYAMTHYEKGEPVVNLMKKNMWEYTAMQTGVDTGIGAAEAEKIRAEIEAVILAEGGKLPQLFNDQ